MNAGYLDRSYLPGMALLDPYFYANRSLDQIGEKVNLWASSASFPCWDGNNQWKLDLFLAFSHAVFDPVEDWVCNYYQ